MTPLSVLFDFGVELQANLQLGLTKLDTGYPGCVGLQSGQGSLILTMAEFMAGDCLRASA